MFRRVMPNFSPGHLIAALVLITLLFVVFDVLWHFLSHSYTDEFRAIDIVNPFITYSAISAHRSGSDIAGIEAAILAVLALAFNVRAMAHASREVLNNPVRAQFELETARRKQAQAAPLGSAALEAGAATS
jgi:hypothetical protein